MKRVGQALKGILLALATVAGFYLFSVKLGQVPPMGRISSPFEGFWRNAEGMSVPDVPQLHRIAGLNSRVNVRIDTAYIPHIEAESEADLFFMQGYVTAQFRLWQMDFITRAAAGRISEVVGPLAKHYDMHQRKIGMVMGAKASLDSMLSNSESKLVLLRYTEGVNAYINSLGYSDYPLEFKILDYKPEPWTPLKTALLLKYMAYSLTGANEDAAMSRILARFGPGVTHELFPNYPSVESPVIPVGTPLDFTPGAVPAADTGGLYMSALSLLKPNPENGSNNWALAGSRTQSGKPMLANDPHLGLNLPSIWLQMQLSCPKWTAIGATLPGAPAIIIGYNRAISWGVTNADADVLDLYKIQFTDKGASHYLYNGKTLLSERVKETIKIRNRPDTSFLVTYTHHGPVAYLSTEKPFKANIPSGTAIRWMAHQGSNEVLTFIRLCRGTKYKDYEAALRHFACPAQNMAYADSTGNIALWVNGRFPLKWREQGKFVLDGTRPGHFWNSYIPHSHNPHVLNPGRAFVSSANQSSTDTTYPYYLNWDFSPSDRALRINQVLENAEDVTVNDMAALQADNVNLLAQRMLPEMLRLTDITQLTPQQQNVLESIKSWNMQNDSAQIGPSLFDQWWKSIADTLWDELEGMRQPTRDMTCITLLKPVSKWHDVAATPQIETRADLILFAFKKTYFQLLKHHGAAGRNWQWGRVKHTRIKHLAQIPGLGIDFISCGGGAGIVNAIGADHGPSFRMVVDFGHGGQAYGILPGGQSGNPGSPFYADMVEKWRNGTLNKLIMYPYRAKEYNSLRELQIYNPL